MSDDRVAAMEDDGWELVAVVRHLGRQHAGQTEYVFERGVNPGKRRSLGQVDLDRGDDHS